MQTSLLTLCLGVAASSSQCSLTYLGQPVTEVPGVYAAREEASVKEKARCKFYNQLSGNELLRRMARERTRHNPVFEIKYKNIERRLKQSV